MNLIYRGYRSGPWAGRGGPWTLAPIEGYKRAGTRDKGDCKMPRGRIKGYKKMIKRRGTPKVGTRVRQTPPTKRRIIKRRSS